MSAGASVNPWDARAQAYRDSPTHASDADLDVVVALCEPRSGRTVLDVATGGGHVARRARELGAQVVTTDLAPGMHPDVICPAEHLPFADASYDVVVTRIAPHHFSDIEAAIGELARVARDAVVVEDTLFTSDAVERAEAVRDPTHVRNLTEQEWRALFERIGLRIDHVEHFEKTHDLDAWLVRTRCTGEEAAEVRELLAEVTSADGSTWHDTKLILRGRKAE